MYLSMKRADVALGKCIRAQRDSSEMMKRCGGDEGHDPSRID